MKKLFYLLVIIILSIPSQAQAQPPTGNQGGARPNMNIGRLYGKVVDENGRGIGYATVQLYGTRFDTASRSMKEALIDGQISEDNGDFSLENLPVMGEFTLKISFLGYAELEQEVSFGVPGPGQGGRPGGERPQTAPPPGNRGNMAAMASKFDKDLGNITLSAASQMLQEVVVEGERAGTTLALDRKVFQVDKLATAAGGTAEDALRSVPSLSVDIDGNVTMRNAAPQIFVDGRPTTLSLDQIAADQIESVEVITNPSAKYDASGGQAGIINIVLKKDRRIGYNGNVRAGIDSRGGINAGGDVNAREGKINAFLSGNFNQRRSWSEGETERLNLSTVPQTNLLQKNDDINKGFFAMGRGGIDWFMDNRHTLNFTGMYMRGKFDSQQEQQIRIDSLFPGGTTSSESLRLTDNNRNFRNTGGSVLFKHLFPKSGKELTADINFNQVRFQGDGNFSTTSLDPNFVSRSIQESNNKSRFLTLQTDYVEPITDNMKIEAGVRAALRRNDNFNQNLLYDPVKDEWIPLQAFANEYNFNDNVYAAYATLSHEFPKWGYQVGMRAESSQYTGNLPSADTSFTNDYPLSLFPSAFVTHKLNEEDVIQLSYSRRVNRPNFFQLMPFTDISDPLNLRRGNPNLRPEFTNSFELTYQNLFPKGHSLLVSLYYKQVNDLITSYQYGEYSEELEREVLVNSYANSNGSQAYGAEITFRNTFLKNFELTSNINLYNSRVDASNVENDLVNEQFSWFIKENLTVKLPANLTLQITGEYQSPAAFNPSDGGGRYGGHWGGSLNTAQGYRLAYWFVDAALRMDIMKRRASLTLSISDIFRSRETGTHTESEFFVQDTWRIRNPQLLRLNFSYRFGKMDASLFKRKNTRMNTEGMDMMN